MPTKANVLLLIGSFHAGGAETQLVQLARLLMRSDRYRPHMACLRKEGILLEEVMRLGLGEVPEYRTTSFATPRAVRQLLRFASYLRRHEIRVVHTEGFYTNVFGLTGAALAGVKARIGFRGEIDGLRTPAQKRLERGVFRFCHTIHANSQAVMDRLVSEGVPRDWITVVHNGLDFARVTPPPGFSRNAFLAGLGLPHGRRFVTIVANLRHAVKDYPTFLRAARRVHDAHPEAAFLSAGEGDLLPAMRNLAVELGIANDVFFLGHCDNIAGLLQVSDVCVLTSTAEGFSNAVLEYMAAGRPVVATNVGGAPEMIVHGESGFLVPSGDDGALAGHVVSLLGDERARLEMGALARLRVTERFSDEAQLRNTELMYDSVLARTHS
jgi:glycosyltransferase involved in cell wall biosynthesis